MAQSKKHKKKRFSIGDTVYVHLGLTPNDQTYKKGIIQKIGSYDDFLKQYRYKVSFPSKQGSRNVKTFNSNSIVKNKPKNATIL